MRRVLVLGRGVDGIRRRIADTDLVLVEDNPDVVLTRGGDGLLLGSERRWPGVPKLPLRHSRHGKKCQGHEVSDALERLLAGDLVVTRHDKVQARALGRELVGLNDVLVHNSSPTSSVRYRVWIDGQQRARELVGDGLVVATPFGSTAYYRTITRGNFHDGLGLAFNNSIEPVDHMVVPESTEIRVLITRGPALLVADNQTDDIELNDGDEILIRKDDSRAIILGL